MNTDLERSHDVRLEEAEGLAREAIAIVKGTGYLVARASAHRALAEVLRAAGRP
jgi:hypothetical protein